MMPKMDGVETTKKLRETGYSRSIVALTANAVAGQADIFLSNGFDDFISKPIDIRQMNLVLNKLIRDKQPPEVIEAARSKANKRNTVQSLVDSEVIEAFVRDALKALTNLERIAQDNNYSNEKNLRSYIINVHGIKSALLNIGKPELSAAALKLEAAGREERFEIITSETPGFLKSLRALAEELTLKTDKEEESLSSPLSEQDTELLRERLLVIKQACEEYDESTAEEALKELKGKPQAKVIKDLLAEISERLLHSDFEEAAAAAERAMSHGKGEAGFFSGKNIPRIDIKKGLESCNNEEKVYIKILRAYADNMHNIAEILESEEAVNRLHEYKITVHGIKGASAAIFAEQLSKEAKALEKAAQEENLDYINGHNAGFIEALRRLVHEINCLLKDYDNENPKPVKDKPDSELLERLRTACNDYDMGAADAVMEELEQYRYEADNGLAEWLRENVDMARFSDISKRLAD
jgi:HPt (histidine-containing phosphotransfer) domain-containing protein